MKIENDTTKYNIDLTKINPDSLQVKAIIDGMREDIRILKEERDHAVKKQQELQTKAFKLSTEVHELKIRIARYEQDLDASK